MNLPFPVTSIPATFQVPTRTTALDIEQSSTIPADFDSSATFGLPDVYGVSHGLTTSATVSSPSVAKGQWSVAPDRHRPNERGSVQLGHRQHDGSHPDIRQGRRRLHRRPPVPGAAVPGRTDPGTGGLNRAAPDAR